MTNSQLRWNLIGICVPTIVVLLFAWNANGRTYGYSYRDAAHAQIAVFYQTLEMYAFDNRCYPDAAIGLAALEERPEGLRSWRGPYVDNGTVPTDPWGMDYAYMRIGGEPRIRSAGPDRIFWNDDDVIGPTPVEKKTPHPAPLVLLGAAAAIALGLGVISLGEVDRNPAVLKRRLHRVRYFDPRGKSIA